MEARNELKKSTRISRLENEESREYLFRLTSLLFSIKARIHTDNRYSFMLDKKKSDNIFLGKLRKDVRECINSYDVPSLLTLTDGPSISLLIKFANTCEITLFQALFMKIAPLLNEPQIFQIKKDLANLISVEKSGDFFKKNHQIFAKNLDLMSSWVDEEIKNHRMLSIRK
ncbi:MAG: hypothetical protein J0I93_04045 [Legionella sp.]|nr:hypothetical protein [Legionella sp.]